MEALNRQELDRLENLVTNHLLEIELKRTNIMGMIKQELQPPTNNQILKKYMRLYISLSEEYHKTLKDVYGGKNQ